MSMTSSKLRSEMQRLYGTVRQVRRTTTSTLDLRFVFPDATANDNYRHDLGYWIGKSEVISNIFDNPELLQNYEVN